MTVIRFNTSLDLDVMFEDGTVIRNKSYDNFKKGLIYNPSRLEIKRLNETKINNQGLLMKIIDYRNCTDLDIQFEDGTIVKNRAYKEFNNGCVSNPNHVTIFDIGYMGKETSMVVTILIVQIIKCIQCGVEC